MRPQHLTPKELERQIFKAFPAGSLERVLVERSEQAAGVAEELYEDRASIHDNEVQKLESKLLAYEDEIGALKAEIEELEDEVRELKQAAGQS